MTDWLNTLYRELDEWNYAGVAATFWWRDDDAQTASPALDALLECAREFDAPVALAVIPNGLDASLAKRLQAEPQVRILQHGFAHVNHAPGGEKKMELGMHRPAEVVLQELRAGMRTLRAAFADAFLPVLVPPWNRMDAALLPELPRFGFTAVSTFGARATAEAAPGLRMVNTHADMIDWKAGGQFIGAARAADAIVAHLQGKRLGDADDEPTGLLTHHLVHDARCWKFLRRLLAALDGHPAVRWAAADAVTPP